MANVAPEANAAAMSVIGGLLRTGIGERSCTAPVKNVPAGPSHAALNPMDAARFVNSAVSWTEGIAVAAIRVFSGEAYFTAPSHIRIFSPELRYGDSAPHTTYPAT